MEADISSPMRFSTADLPEQERIARFREEICRVLVRVDLEPLPDQPLDVSWTMSTAPGLGVIACSNSGIRMERDAAMAADADNFTLTLNLDGVGSFRQRGREIVIDAGEAVFMAHAEPATLIHFGGRQIAMAVPRQTLAPLVAGIDDFAPLGIPAGNEGLRLLKVYLQALHEDVKPQTPELRRVAAGHLHELMALAIGTAREATDLAQMRGVRAARVREIISQIKSGFAEPSFSPNTVAARLRLSPRYVQDLLQETGESFTERVLEMRLQKARRMLALSVNDRLTVSDIAYACGFNEVSYFNRRFRRRFGAPPLHFRGKGAEIY